MMSKKMVKVLCIILAILMLLSGVAVLTQVFAVSSVPDTGVEDIKPAYLIIGAVLCLLIIVICIILPKLKKNTSESDDAEEMKGENIQ